MYLHSSGGIGSVELADEKLISTIKICGIISVDQGSTVHQRKGGADNDCCQKKMEPVPEKRERSVEENNEEGQDIMVSHASRRDVIRALNRPCNFERRAFSILQDS